MTSLRALLAVLLVLAPAVPVTAESQEPYSLQGNPVWESPELDILVLTGGDPLLGVAFEQAFEAWRVGIATYGPTWLQEGLVLRIHFAGDALPPAGFEADDIEIAVIPQGGLAVTVFRMPVQDEPFCAVLAPYAWERAYSTTAMYRVAAHEIGHCLGLGHVFHEGTEYEPGFDIMGGGRGPACVSNLDVMALELVYGGHFGQPSGGTITMSPSEYVQSDC